MLQLESDDEQSNITSHFYTDQQVELFDLTSSPLDLCGGFVFFLLLKSMLQSFLTCIKLFIITRKETLFFNPKSSKTNWNKSWDSLCFDRFSSDTLGLPYVTKRPERPKIQTLYFCFPRVNKLLWSRSWNRKCFPEWRGNYLEISR